MVTKKPKGLGLWLEALLGPKVNESASASAAGPTTLPLDQLQSGRYQPRTRMDEGALYELAESIKSQGVMQPVLVRELGPQRYEIIAGERRCRAARLAGLTEVPVLVRAAGDQDTAVMALIENMQREDLNPLEEAQGLHRLVQEFGWTHEQAAQAVGRSRSAASNLLRLLQLAPAVQKLLLAGDLEMGHARALLGLQASAQVQAAQEVVARKLTVRETEKLVAQQLNTGRQAALLRLPQDKPRDVLRLEEQLSDALAAVVSIRLKGGRGSTSRGELSIAFGSLEELSGLLQRLGVSPD